MNQRLRVLIADDSIVFRKIVRDSLASIPYVDVVGHAENGAVALRRIRELQPDVVTLDIEMPEMSGLSVLRQLRGSEINTAALVVSSLTSTGARFATQALEAGAFDFILKPTSMDMKSNVQSLRESFEPRLNELRRRLVQPADDATEGTDATACGVVHEPAANVIRTPEPTVCKVPQVVAIGTSTGGPVALNKLLPMLPEDLSVPVLIVQHMPPMFTKTLADDLNRRCHLHVREAQGGERIEPGQCYIAPGGRQMKVVRTSAGVFVRVTDDPAEQGCRPSVDYLFRSVSKAYDDRVLAVVMTGMGDDGSRSLREMHPRGVHVIAQDEASSTVFGMPRRVIEDGNADIICPLNEIAGNIQRIVHRRSFAQCI
ncbi:MAG: chemotaxis response regulator protein-glutamate methylesterase [Pirellulaceae bacterium]